MPHGRDYGVALAAMLTLGVMAGGCAQSGSADTVAQSAAPAAAQQPQGYSDQQLTAYVAARGEISALTPASTPEQQAATQAQISQILSRHGINAITYNEISERAAEDEALRNRIAAMSVSAPTDAELRAFAAASLEIGPLAQTLSTATPEQQQQVGEQIRAILARHGISYETYNGIASQAQSDAALAAQINALRVAQATPPAEEPGPEPTPPPPG